MTVLREDGFEGFLKRQVAQMNGILVHGSDSAAIANIGRMVARIVCDATAEPERYDVAILKDGAGRIEDHFFSLSLLGDRLMLWFDDVSDQHLKPLDGLINAKGPANFLFLAADSLPKSSKLRQACEESNRFAALALYEETTGSAKARLRALLAKEKNRWGDGAEEVFFDVVGSERSIVTQEFEKLILYCHGQASVETNDVVAICGDTADGGNDQLIDAVLIGDLSTVDRTLQILDGDIRVALIAVASHLSRLQDLRSMMDSGNSADQAVKAARPPIFFKRQPMITSQLKRFDGQALMAMQATVASAIFESRKSSDLANAITGRTLLALARLARSKSA
ncbi:MAG: hypothetical protein KGO94_04545 [Alphaproteobacteria bacterium]|nr:hypothetical protein [Alphaproteobacteria bacterium]